jgi:hypothetical protein
MDMPDTGAPTTDAGESVADASAADIARMTSCADYCSVYLANCGDFAANTYDDEDDCSTTCFGSDWPVGTQATSGSIACRAWHADLAEGSQNPHCYHSAEAPTQGGCQ